MLISIFLYPYDRLYKLITPIVDSIFLYPLWSFLYFYTPIPDSRKIFPIHHVQQPLYALYKKHSIPVLSPCPYSFYIPKSQGDYFTGLHAQNSAAISSLNSASTFTLPSAYTALINPSSCRSFSLIFPITVLRT